ncbi:hypothetical protein PY093_09145 [Cytobacillus sp. S13-E01]|uniref:hypothetical protein n=1 Tax=Cytobacillus sp. S13-E01 TaxID=3031326 RepID=UPI0023D85EFF|nr:hypothetical protein [Cytobacillus sp. S13-E01]MDF0726880.1 hypothetical protein [Cytobacillus sp. S13-E01]
MTKRKVSKDLLYEGKDEVLMDVDRFINEGMAGGTVHRKHGSTNIEEARDFETEEPPANMENG